jgi:hypothetical protein
VTSGPLMPLGLTRKMLQRPLHFVVLIRVDPVYANLKKNLLIWKLALCEVDGWAGTSRYTFGVEPQLFESRRTIGVIVLTTRGEKFFQ